MANRWKIDEQKVEAVTDFIFWAPKSLQIVTAAMKIKDDCSLEEKAMNNLDSILKVETLPQSSILSKLHFFH